MMFDEVLARVLGLFQHEGRVSCRALKRRFALDRWDSGIDPRAPANAWYSSR